MFDNDSNQYDLVSQERGEDLARRVSLYLAKVMGWMCVGLFTTLASALFCYAVPQIFYALNYTNVIYAIFLLQLGVVMAIGTAARKASPGVATFLFLLYAVMTGLTFTALFALFDAISLIYVFGVTALVFVAMSVYGFATKKDLTRAGSLAFFGLLGIIVAGIFNMFMGSGMMDFVITVAGIGIFIVLTAYDTQRIKAVYLDAVHRGADEDGPELQKLAIYGALTLYLDFINLFLKLLRLLGRRRN